jgi:PKD repeat protein
MKYIFTIVSLFGLMCANAQTTKRCDSEEFLQYQISKHPELLQKRADYEKEMQSIIQQQTAGKSSQGTQLITYVVPVVVHVIHQYGTENISDAQIEDQIKILNEDFQRKNIDSNNTPVAFRPAAGRMSIEFRLARKDPNGNCTNSIVRVVDALTNGTSSFTNRDDVKSLSYWNATKYLNIWIVKTITSSNPTQTVLGYAQFPGLGALNTEGLVLRSDATGSIGTAVGTSSNKGRTATHEIGHCMGLRHIWGDDGTACTGSDNITDTPNQADENYGCPSFPQVSCGNGPNGDMFMNYMDYVDDACMNMFSVGQVTKMNTTMNSAIGGRSNLWTPANLIATGTDIPNTPIVCKPKPTYIVNNLELCAGGSLNFSDKSWGSVATSWSWTFQGGTPSTSNSSSPVITYNTPGVYDVKLVVTNSAGSDSITDVAKITVKSNIANIQALNYIQSFPPNFNFSANDYQVVDPDGDLAFGAYSGAGIGDNSCVYLDNSINSPGKIDYLYTPTINFSLAPTDAKLRFYMAYQKDNTTRNDKFFVQYSNDCGINWSNLLSKQSNSTSIPLATVSAINTSGVFNPTNASQWRKETVNIASLIGNVNASNTRLRFVFIADNVNGFGLPLFLDSISLTSISSGLNQIKSNTLSCSIFPNPTEGKLKIELFESSTVGLIITLSDLLGRKINVSAEELKKINNQVFELDVTNKCTKGVYLMQIKQNDKTFDTKITIIK